MNITENIKCSLFDSILPTYILDEDWNFIAMNTAFSCLFGSEWGCEIGLSVFDVVEKLDNKKEVLQRAAVKFSAGSEVQVDHEHLRFTSSKYGKVEARKIAVKIFGENNQPNFWILQLNVLSSDNLQRLFDDMLSTIDKGRHQT